MISLASRKYPIARNTAKNLDFNNTNYSILALFPDIAQTQS